MSSKSLKKNQNKDASQIRFDKEIIQTVIKSGCQNNYQARYYQEICSLVVGNELPIYETLQPELKIKKSKAWNQAINIVNSYLNKYEMVLSLETMKIEFKNNPTSVSRKNSSIIDSVFSNLISFSKNLSQLTFSKRVQEFNNELEQDISARK